MCVYWAIGRGAQGNHVQQDWPLGQRESLGYIIALATLEHHLTLPVCSVYFSLVSTISTANIYVILPILQILFPYYM